VALTIERWEKEYWDHPRIAASVRSHAMIAQMTLLKSPTKNVNINVGDNSNFQIGSNVSDASGNIAAGQTNVIGADLGSSIKETSVEPLVIKYSNIIAGIMAGLLAGWWCLPQWTSLGPTRLTLTVVVIVASVVLSLLNWFQFRRRNWEKFAYIGLGSVLILHSTIPSFAGAGSAHGEIESGNPTGNVVGYLTFTDEPFYGILEIVLGVVVLFLGFRTKTSAA
jgi:hypothetical protein